MTPPPAPAVVIGVGLAWNLRNSVAGKPTISGWACRHKKAALTIGGGFFAWVLAHWALYVIELPDP